VNTLETSTPPPPPTPEIAELVAQAKQHHSQYGHWPSIFEAPYCNASQQAKDYLLTYGYCTSDPPQ
jgi:hypothetical protein